MEGLRRAQHPGKELSMDSFFPAPEGGCPLALLAATWPQSIYSTLVVR